ncbi:MAG: hypothetical protein J07HQX50_02046 [Haloquadratum sp. J07HQX50]|nr:MAG: hypothetical protein J07HQX50_02046 [Haloquadratum sp. J07HQX50]
MIVRLTRLDLGVGSLLRKGDPSLGLYSNRIINFMMIYQNHPYLSHPLSHQCVLPDYICRWRLYEPIHQQYNLRDVVQYGQWNRRCVLCYPDGSGVINSGSSFAGELTRSETGYACQSREG